MRTRTLILSALLLIVLGITGTSCASSGADSGGGQAALLVTDGTTEKAYTAADLEALPGAEAVFQEVTYLGVPLAQLLTDAGFDPGAIRAVRAVAADGFSANYEPALFNLPDTLVAYGRTDGPMTEEEGAFRMVLPGQEGKLNVRLLTRIEVIP